MNDDDDETEQWNKKCKYKKSKLALQEEYINLRLPNKTKTQKVISFEEMRKHETKNCIKNGGFRNIKTNNI